MREYWSKLSIWQFYSWTFSLENETISVKITSLIVGVFEKISVEYKFPSLRKQPSFFAPGPSGISCKMPLGPGAEKDGCFRRALHVSSLSIFCLDFKWFAMTGKTCFGSATLKSAQNFRPEKKILSKVSGELWEVCGLMVIALVSECQAVWVQALAGDIVLCSG